MLDNLSETISQLHILRTSIETNTNLDAISRIERLELCKHIIIVEIGLESLQYMLKLSDAKQAYTQLHQQSEPEKETWEKPN